MAEFKKRKRRPKVKFKIEDINYKKLKFSDKAKFEIGTYLNAVTDIVALTTDSYINSDINNAKRIEPFEESIDILNAKAKKHHIKRLQKGKCNIENSVVIEVEHTKSNYSYFDR